MSILRVNSITPYTGSLLTVNGDILLTGNFTGSSVGNVGTRLTNLESETIALESFTSSVNSRLDSVQTYTASVSTSVGILQSTASLFVPLSTSVDSRLGVVEATASLYVPLSTSVDSRLVRLATTGSNIFVGNQTVSGSLTVSGSAAFTGSTLGNIVSMSIVSNTASIDFSAGNYFTLTLSSGSIPTRLNPSNVKPGQTISLVVTQAATLSGSLSFPTIFKFPTGSYYTASKVANAMDVLTFITVDTASIHAVSVKSMGI